MYTYVGKISGTTGFVSPTLRGRTLLLSCGSFRTAATMNHSSPRSPISILKTPLAPPTELAGLYGFALWPLSWSGYPRAHTPHRCNFNERQGPQCPLRGVGSRSPQLGEGRITVI